MSLDCRGKCYQPELELPRLKDAVHITHSGGRHGAGIDLGRSPGSASQATGRHECRRYLKTSMCVASSIGTQKAGIQ
jgi:hypothetical protein